MISGRCGLSWWPERRDEHGSSIEARDGSVIRVQDIDAIWWRRVNAPQRSIAPDTDAGQAELINNDCNGALLGLVLTDFRGRWINNPTASSIAENKLVQLRSAFDVGLRVPRTLVTNEPSEVSRFFEIVNRKAVVKPIRGTTRIHVFTTKLTIEHLGSEDSLRLAPAIYQEYIPGTRHIRVHFFGATTHAVMIESHELDWRRNLNVKMTRFALDVDTETKARKVLQNLGLEMGIVDLKLTPDDEVVWLELNPQGQFLFVEAASGLDLTTAFAEFLASQASKR